jgi:hypothetical protein
MRFKKQSMEAAYERMLWIKGCFPGHPLDRKRAGLIGTPAFAAGKRFLLV